MKNATFNLDEAINRALLMQRVKDFLRLRKTHGDELHIKASAYAYYGTPKLPIKLIFASKGHMVNQANVGLCNFVSMTSFYNGQAQYSGGMYNLGVGSSGVPSVPSIRLGTGTGSTTAAMTALAAIINTPPNTIGGVNSSPVANKYRMALTATWNIGTLSAVTVNEAGLFAFLPAPTTQQAFGAANLSSGVVMIDRMNSTDGDFPAFTIDTTKPLSYQYNFDFTF